jgi:hypothetical protein
LFPGILSLAACLRQQTHFYIALYPLDIRELGGTTNVSGNTLQGMGHQGFVHLELSYPLRKLMQQNENTLQTVVNCLELNQ